MLTLRETEVDAVALGESCVALIRPRAEAKDQHLGSTPPTADRRPAHSRRRNPHRRHGDEADDGRG